MGGMTRLLRLTLCAALLAVSWPAAAVERAAEIRAVPPAALMAPSVLSVPALPGGPRLGEGLAAPAGLPGAALPPALAPATASAGPQAGASASARAQASQAVVPAASASSRPSARASAEAPRPAEPAPVAASPSSAPAAPAAGAAGTAGPAEPGEPQAAWTDGAARFDHAASSKRGSITPVSSGAAPALRALAPAAALGALSLPLVAAHAHVSLSAMAPAMGGVGYDLANVLSVAFPLPEAYSAFRRGHAHGFPIVRALIGALGTVALGTVNAVVLGKPLWGVMHVFIGVGMVAPYVIGRILERRGPLAPYVPPQWAQKPSKLKALAHRLRRDRALLATVGVAAVMLAIAFGVYAAAAAFVPALLAAHLSAGAIADLLLGIQIAKGALFVAVFAPDVAALIKGQPTRGFSASFTTIYLASVAAFTLWGFSAAAMAAPGPIRDQYLVHGLRNLCETIASALSLWALYRARKKA